jgi:hypothetical protein
MFAEILGQAQPFILGAMASGGSIVLALSSDHLIRQLKLRRFLPLIRRSFEIIDPLLCEYMGAWGPSTVRFVIELTTRVLADGDLSTEEAAFLYKEIERRFSPVKAAAYKPLLTGSQEYAAYQAIQAAVINGRPDSLGDTVAKIREIVVATKNAGV